MADTFSPSVRDGRLHDDVSRQIARQIVLGKLPVGTTLPAETELIARFGVSRMVIREALRRLEEAGMIVIRHGRRTVIAAEEEWDVLDRLVLTSYREEGLIGPLLRDSLRVRQMLEPAIAAEATQRVNPALLQALEDSLARQALLFAQPDTFLVEDIAFHNLLAAAMGNRILMRLLVTIRDLLHVSREVTNEFPNAIPGALAAHRHIYDAVRSGEAARAYRAMKDHLDGTLPRVWPESSTRQRRPRGTDTAGIVPAAPHRE
ncbi:MAG TPA: FadR/GntR family transcriptional regulator [Thermomicrobiales bacterium]|jgi:DNA-binding FadR family transcriptional regulator